jgi:hypothetical protein
MFLFRKQQLEIKLEEECFCFSTQTTFGEITKKWLQTGLKVCVCGGARFMILIVVLMS